MPTERSPLRATSEDPMPSQSGSDYWTPGEGVEVWMNRPDGRKLGTVVGFVPDAHPHRGGQPIVQGDDGQHFAIAPMFVLPFEHGGEEWRRARDEGRVR